MTRSNRWKVFGLLAALALVTGCGGGPEFVAVTGVVTKDKQPLGNVRVEFWPETSGDKSTAVTDAEGRYSLKTEDGQKEGAVVGPHRVILKDLNMYGEKFLGRKAENVRDLSGGKKPRFSPKLGEGSSTALKKTVTSGQPNTIDIEVP